MATVPTKTDCKILCHCLRVTESQIHEAVVIAGCRDVKDVMDCTEAGSGCTACHRRILAFLAEKSAQASCFSTAE
jgi:NAD(P)H-nitrite reductase large subunit